VEEESSSSSSALVLPEVGTVGFQVLLYLKVFKPTSPLWYSYQQAPEWRLFPPFLLKLK